MEVEYSMFNSVSPRCYYRIAKGKENGTTSIVVTMTYAGESASVTVPVTITDMPTEYEKINDLATEVKRYLNVVSYFFRAT